jgi:tRNA (cytidine/uridine-2'-O-)-methyltransferase
MSPEIPGNTGNVGRLAVGLGVPLHLIEPLGFDLTEKAVRRAGIDHWKKVDLVVHRDLDAFLAWVGEKPLHLFSAKATRPYTQMQFVGDEVLLFGPESVGLPEHLLERFPGWKIPLPGPVRSLNLSNAVSIAAYHALMSTSPEHF